MDISENLSGLSGGVNTFNQYVSSLFENEFFKYFVILLVLVVLGVIVYILVRTYGKEHFEIKEIFQDYGDNKNRN